MAKILIITNGNYFAVRILSGLFLERPEEIAGVIVVRGDYYGNTGFVAARKLLRKSSARYLAYKAFTVFLFRALSYFDRGSAWDLETALDCYQVRTPFLSVERVSDPRVGEMARQIGPDLLISVSCPQKIGPDLLELPRYGALNIHSSLLPTYAGLAPYFWVLARGEKTTGTTVHRMTERWDAGDVLSQRSVDIPDRTSAFSLFKTLADQGSGALVEAVGRALRGDTGWPQETVGRSYYSHPTRQACNELRRRGHCLFQLSDFSSIFAGAREHEVQVISKAVRYSG